MPSTKSIVSRTLAEISDYVFGKLIALPCEATVAVRRIGWIRLRRGLGAQGIVIAEAELLDPFGRRAAAVAAHGTQLPSHSRMNDSREQRLTAVPAKRFHFFSLPWASTHAAITRSSSSFNRFPHAGMTPVRPSRMDSVTRLNEPP